MATPDTAIQDQTATTFDIATLFVSLELSPSKWFVTSLSPGSKKLSKHMITGSDSNALLDLLARVKGKAEQRMNSPIEIVVIQEAGLDGFWIHRLLLAQGIESHVVEAASIAVPRRHRRSKTDRIDGEMLLRTLMAFKRGEPRVCSMVIAPSPEEEDLRRLSRERRTLVKERTRHINRIKGLLMSQGIKGYQPNRRDCHQRLEALQTGDGRPLPTHLKTEVLRELDRLDLVKRQIAEVEAARNALLRSVQEEARSEAGSPGAQLMKLRSIGPEFASVLWLEGFYRRFNNRRQLAAYAGLAPSPWRSGKVNRDQGIAKSGNPRLRTTMVELAWLWLRHQPNSALSRWFHDQVQGKLGRSRKVAIVALARKLLIALWRYVAEGVVPEGAVFKPA
ncbi:MAG: IS110 family transposase [Alphaproteobacteria bacterium GM202ARS2]|nr:IS110 family transposase [Alphaproteobacteria bacterium GM202ARS2]